MGYSYREDTEVLMYKSHRYHALLVIIIHFILPSVILNMLQLIINLTFMLIPIYIHVPMNNKAPLQSLEVSRVCVILIPANVFGKMCVHMYRHLTPTLYKCK